MATDNVGFNAIFGAIATFGGIMLIESFGFLLLSIGIGMLCMAFYGSAHQKRLGSSPYDYQTATQKETIINYGKFH